jgi:hypothetical protein
MNKKHILLIANTIMFLLSPSPTLAQANTPPTQSKKISRLHLLTLSRAVAGFCAGFVVGTPVCFVKRLVSETDYGAHEMVGGFTDDKSDSKLILVPVTIMWLPAATLTAFMEAPCDSFKHAIEADEPFSKEQFSLNDFEKSDPH